MRKYTLNVEQFIKRAKTQNLRYDFIGYMLVTYSDKVFSLVSEPNIYGIGNLDGFVIYKDELVEVQNEQE